MKVKKSFSLAQVIMRTAGTSHLTSLQTIKIPFCRSVFRGLSLVLSLPS